MPVRTSSSLTIAVTGASGFLGRYVVAELLRHPVNVIALSRDAQKLASLPAQVHVLQKDLRAPGPRDYDELGRPDVLLHLAWEGLPQYQELFHFEQELPRQYQFLKGLINAGLPAVVVSGTCLEYGHQSGALREDLPARPTTAYGYAKAALYQQLVHLNRAHPFALTWARLFYLYGPGQHEQSLYSKLHRACAQGDRHFSMSGGEQLRDYLPVTEAARLLVALTLRQAPLGLINVCSGHPTSVRTLAEMWLRTLGNNMALDLGRYPYPDYEPMAFWGNRAYLDQQLAS